MKFNTQNLTILFSIIIFLAGFVLYTSDAIILREEKERLQNNPNCPNLLVRKGNSLLLYDTTKKEDSENPISFFDLDGYAEYVKNQHRNGIHCPVLYLQRENNTQGKDVYKMHSSPFFLENGLPSIPLEINDNTIPIQTMDAGRDNAPWNQNQYASFDPHGLNVGRFNDIDVIHQSTEQKGQFSENPADSNWGGVIFTQQAVNDGNYADREVGKVIFPKMSPK